MCAKHRHREEAKAWGRNGSIRNKKGAKAGKGDPWSKGAQEKAGGGARAGAGKWIP